MGAKASDLYEILSVDRNASREEIRMAYKKLAVQWHPDKNSSPDATDKFQKIQIAYETLSDDQKRMAYDNFDCLENATRVKEIFMSYHQLIAEMFEKYDVPEEEKEEIYSLFDPKDFEEELKNDDVWAVYGKLTGRLWAYSKKYIAAKFASEHPYISSIFNFFAG